MNVLHTLANAYGSHGDYKAIAVGFWCKSNPHSQHMLFNSMSKFHLLNLSAILLKKCRYFILRY
jgi:hypothetical protein